MKAINETCYGKRISSVLSDVLDRYIKGDTYQEILSNHSISKTRLTDLKKGRVKLNENNVDVVNAMRKKALKIVKDNEAKAKRDKRVLEE